MHFGGAMFFTDYSMPASELARALEERGFESVWAPEHSHIPLSRKTPFPGGGDLPKQYYDAMDPFVVLAAAAQATKNHKTRHRRGAHSAARPDPDRQAGRLD
jgi:alkanesulfonate monooxygenase SsuD/methylene tetrahydromethanopterin reductase-like flavin-dependent oxidoreductase (luciferase family)